MKSIDDTLKIIRDSTNAIPVKFDIVLDPLPGTVHLLSTPSLFLKFLVDTSR